jgi:hypothetical protein
LVGSLFTRQYFYPKQHEDCKNVLRAIGSEAYSADVTVQLGVFVGPRGRGKTLEAARVFLELRSGRVMLGQFYDETEKCIALGLATNW